MLGGKPPRVLHYYTPPQGHLHKAQPRKTEAMTHFGAKGSPRCLGLLKLAPSSCDNKLTVHSFSFRASSSP